MGSKAQPVDRMEEIQSLMESLLSQDLTLGQARDLRGRVFALTGVDQESEAATPTNPTDGRRDGPRPSGCRHCAA